jgi:hypothetical protein
MENKGSKMSKIPPMPARIRQSRKRGARMYHPNGFPCLSVARPSRWGNPCRIGVGFGTPREQIVAAFAWYAAVRNAKDPSWLAPLRGKNLACFCPLGVPCHADVLLEMANTVPPPAAKR